MGFQFLGPRSTVLSPSDPRPPTVGRSGGWACSFVFLLYIHVIVVWLHLSRRNGSLSSSPPFRLALALHLPTQLTTIEVGPGWGTFSLPFTTLLPPLWPRPLESKVIQIQSDHPPAFSPPVAAMERSKVICSIQVWGRAVGLSSKVSLDFAGLGSPCSWAPLLFLLLDIALYTDDLLTFEMDKSTWWLKRVWFPSSAPPSLFFRRASGLLSEGTTLSSSPFFFPPCAAPFSQVPLGRILHALEMTFAMLTHWVPLTVSLASHLLDIFSTVVWLGLATCWRRTSERNLSVGSLHALVLRFTRFHQVLGWSSWRPRPIGTCFSTGSMVPSLWSAPSSFEIPALRVPRYRLAPVDCFFSSSVTGKAPC